MDLILEKQCLHGPCEQYCVDRGREGGAIVHADHTMS